MSRYNGDKYQMRGENVIYFAEMDSPVGVLLLTADESGLTGIRMDRNAPPGGTRKEDHLPLQAAKLWLDAYFRGEDPDIKVPLNLKGTPFQRQIWQLLLTIPFGETRTYGFLAPVLTPPMTWVMHSIPWIRFPTCCTTSVLTAASTPSPRC